MYRHMERYQLPLDNKFYDVIVPITKEYLKVFTRENARSLGAIATTCGALKANDAELWGLIFKKLQDDGLHKYITLHDTVYLLEALVNHGSFNQHPLIQTLFNTILTHKKFYEHYPHLLNIIDRISTSIKSSGGIKRPEQPQLDKKV